MVYPQSVGWWVGAHSCPGMSAGCTGVSPTGLGLSGPPRPDTEAGGGTELSPWVLDSQGHTQAGESGQLSWAETPGSQQ